MRRLFHFTAGLLLVFILAYVDRKQGIIIALSLFIIVSITETVRLTLPEVNRLFLRFFNPLLRGEEERKPTGTAYFLGGILLSILLFDRNIALLSITILTVGDPAGSAVGKRWGSYRIRGKSIEGSIAFLITSAVTGLLLKSLWPELPAEVIVTGAATGALTELISSRVNDNLLIPLAASGAMKALLIFLSLF